MFINNDNEFNLVRIKFQFQTILLLLNRKKTVSSTILEPNFLQSIANIGSIICIDENCFPGTENKQSPAYFVCFSIHLIEKCRRPYMRYNCKAEENDYKVHHL